MCTAHAAHALRLLRAPPTRVAKRRGWRRYCSCIQRRRLKAAAACDQSAVATRPVTLRTARVGHAAARRVAVSRSSGRGFVLGPGVGTTGIGGLCQLCQFDACTLAGPPCSLHAMPGGRHMQLQLPAHPKLKGVRHVVQAEPDGFLQRADFNRAIAQLKVVYDLMCLFRNLPSSLVCAIKKLAIAHSPNY